MEDNLRDAAPLVPLVVDLDGTLCRSDTFHEALVGLIATYPLALLSAPRHLMRGKAALKRHVADHLVVDATSLPYDPAVIALIAAARAAGRTTALVSAADHRQVEAVADHLGCFDQAIGTGSPEAAGENLGGAAKARFLEATFGEQGFDYVGDSRPDLPVWSVARKALAVRPSGALRDGAKQRGVALTAVAGTERGGLAPLIRAMRPHQWAKNLLVFVPALAAHQPGAFWPAVLALVCFSLVASGVYLVNDLVDLPADRAHPRKRLRPFASGALAVSGGVLAAGVLFLAGVALALALLPPAFSGVLLLYVVATFAYSFWLKRKMMVDVIGLAGLYTLRIIGGGAATEIVLSPWLLVFSMFVFFTLATVKRLAELEDAVRMGRDSAPGRNLHLIDLPILQGMAIASGQAAVLVLALYVQDAEVRANYAAPNILLLVCPVLFFWLSRIQILTRRGHMSDDPLVFALRDRVSLLSGILMLALGFLAFRGI